MPQSHVTIDIPESLWMSSNQRPHWGDKARRTAGIRHLGKLRARDLHTYEQAHVTAYIAYSRAGRADPANAAPTVKALIDGIVDAGVLPDDDHTHLIGPDYRRDPNTGVKGLHRIRLVFTDQAHEF